MNLGDYEPLILRILTITILLCIEIHTARTNKLLMKMGITLKTLIYVQLSREPQNISKIPI